MFTSGRFCHSFASFCALSLVTTRIVVAQTEPAPAVSAAPTSAQPTRLTSPQFTQASGPNGSPEQATLYWPNSLLQEDAGHERPKYLNYDSAKPIPSGYKLQTYIPRGYIIGGSITFGVAYGLGLISALSSQDKDFQAHWLLLPVLGPFIGMATQHDTCTRGTVPPVCQRDPDTLVTLAIFGGMQIVGAGLFMYGVTHPRQRLLRTDHPSFVVAPGPVGLGGYGFAAKGIF